MALHEFAELNGHRFDLTHAVRTSKRTCEACGEYLTDDQAVKGTLTIEAGTFGQATVAWDSHPEHTGRSILVAIDQAAAKLQL